MKNLGTQGLRALKLLHLVSAFLWIGGALSMMLILVVIHPEENSEMYLFSMSLKALDDILVIYGAYGCLLTGLIYGIFTKWGFFKHKWILAKWILTLLMILSGTFLMGPCVDGNALSFESLPLQVIDTGEFWKNVRQTTNWGYVQLACLLLTIIISVYKPWKNKV